MRLDLFNFQDFSGTTVADFTIDGVTKRAIVSPKLLSAPGKPEVVSLEFVKPDGSVLRILCLEDEAPGIAQFMAGDVWG